MTTIISVGVPTTMSVNVPTTMSANVPTTMSVNVPTTMSANVPTTMSANVPTTMSVNVPTTMSMNVPTTMSMNVPTTMSANVPTTTNATTAIPIYSNYPVTGIIIPEPQSTNSNRNGRRPKPIDTTHDNVPFNPLLFVLQITRIWSFIAICTAGMVAATYLNCRGYATIQDESIEYHFFACIFVATYLAALDFACIALRKNMKAYKISRFNKHTIINIILTIAFVLIVIFVVYDSTIYDFGVFRARYVEYSRAIANGAIDSDSPFTQFDISVHTVINAKTDVAFVKFDTCEEISYISIDNISMLILQIHIIVTCIYICSFINFVDTLIELLLVVVNVWLAITAINAFVNNFNGVFVTILCTIMFVSVSYIVITFIKHPEEFDNRTNF